MQATTDTKSLFLLLIKRFECDLVLDIGSRDGKQAILFKDVLPQARVVAFEANPRNFQKMACNPLLTDRVTVLPWAVSDADGQATFHIADADYEASETADNNLGISSLLVQPGVKASEHVEVRTVRLDALLREPEYQQYQSIALWVDAESAEYLILDGMRGVADRVKVMHVETAKTPLRIGQRTYDEVVRLVTSFNFTEAGSDLGTRDLGDVVFVQNTLLPQIRSAQAKASLYSGLRIHYIAAFLRNHSPFLFRMARKVYVKMTS
jgi:FkbM family methyltransferase